MEKVILVLLILQDGSKIQGELQTTDISIKTKYGNLTVPVQQISHIDFGLHFPDDMQKKVSTLLEEAASPGYKDRESATQELIKLGRYSIPAVKKGLESDNLELKKRCELIMAKIAYQYQAEGDLMQLVEGWSVLGTLPPTPIVVKNSILGEVKFLPHALKKMVVQVNLEQTIKMDAVDADKAWVDTGLDLSLFKAKITTTGVIDLWVQQPGQYTTGAGGYSQRSHNSPWPAGALIGKVGNGVEFLVGAEYNTNRGDIGFGRLYLRIANSPWAGGTMSGSYEVKIARTIE